MATTGRFPSTARPTFMRTSRTFNIGFGNSWEALWKYLSLRQELCGDYGRFNSCLSKSAGWCWESKGSQWGGHVVIGTWPKKITRWKELACEQHGQSFAHASRQTGEDVVPILMVNRGGDDVGLQLSYFQCHSDGKQVLRQHTWKSCKSGGRAGWLCCKRL